jgi:hypothetical protein
LKSFIHIALLALLLFICEILKAQQPETLYWYQHGKSEKWFSQNDVFIFRNTNHEYFPLLTLPGVVKFHFFRDDKPDRLNIVYFDEKSDLLDRNELKNKIRIHPEFESEFPAITLFPEKKCEEGQWLATDDLLAVQFNDSSLSFFWLNDFMGMYGVSLHNEEEILKTTSTQPVYIFKINSPFLQGNNSVELCRTMFEDDSILIKNAVPNKIVAFRPVTDILSSDVLKRHNDYQEKIFYVSLDAGKILKVFFKTEAKEHNFSIRVFDALGQEIIRDVSCEFADNPCQIDMSNTIQGIYYAVLFDRSGNLYQWQRFWR